MKAFPKFDLSKLIGLCIAILGLQACTFQDAKSPGDLSLLLGPAVVSFESVKSQVFAPSCIRCHGTDGGVNLENYASASAAASRINTAVFAKQSMPKESSLTGQQLATLKAWLDAGAPEAAVYTGTSGTPLPTQTPITPIQVSELSFANINSKVFKSDPSSPGNLRCANCHKTPEAIDLTRYSSTRENIAAIALATLTDRSMPKRQPLDPQQSALLTAWIKAGAPEFPPGTEMIRPTYESIYRSIFKPLCMNCHGNGKPKIPGTDKPSKKVPLAPYKAIMDTKNDTVVAGDASKSSLIEALTNDVHEENHMPPLSTHLAPLPEEMVQVIRTWINQGAPEK